MELVQIELSLVQPPTLDTSLQFQVINQIPMTTSLGLRVC